MLEPQNLIQTTLNLAGEKIQFSGCTIKGIPGHLVYNIQNFDSPYDIDKQDIDFQVSKQDFKNNTLELDNRFTFEQGEDQYCFRIIKIIDDLTGWLQLSVSLEDLTSV